MRKVVSLGTVCGIALLGSLGFGSEIADANRLFVLEKYEDAIGIYENVVSRENGEGAAEALFGLARAYQMLGRWKLARDGFERLLREQEDAELAPESRIQLGQCEIRLGNLQKALSLFKEVEEKHAGQQAAIEATYHIANLDVGFSGRDVRKARAAIEGYRRVLSSDQGKRYAVPSYFGLGRCYMLLEDYARAIESFRVVVEKGPDTVWARYARDQSLNALMAFGNAELAMRLREGEFWLSRHFALPNYSQMDERPEWRLAGDRPALRVYAIEFSTEQPKDGAGVEKVFYSAPTIYFKNYVFRSEHGIVDRAHRLVECAGKVQCMDDVLPPTLTVTSGALTLDLTGSKAVFSQNVSFEKRSGEQTVQQLLVEELHLMLDSGAIEVPAGASRTETLSK